MTHYHISTNLLQIEQNAEYDLLSCSITIIITNDIYIILSLFLILQVIIWLSVFQGFNYGMEFNDHYIDSSKWAEKLN
jgi:hypothetical protein